MKNFKEYFIITASPEDVFNALTNEATIQLWSGDPAVMSATPDTLFSIFDGSIEGRNIEFETGKKIVQEWFFGETDEPSIVTILLHPHKHGTSAEVRHINIPEEAYDNIVSGWKENYFGALEDFYS